MKPVDEQFAGERYDRDASSDGRATRHRNAELWPAKLRASGFGLVYGCSPGEGTSVRFYPLGPFTRTRPDGEVAPIPAVPAPTIGWPKSTHNGRSLRLTLSICLPLLFEIQ